jgi:fermentation-respiration switch protein FrsA (DUF1100 family)
LIEIFPKSPRALGKAALRVGLAVFAVLALALIFERRFIYYPERAHEATPAQMGVPAEEVALRAEDGVNLHGWYLPVEDARFTILFNHGNAGNISHRLDRALLLQAKLHASVLLYDYRGYGKSEGSPDEEGTYRDAQAAHRYLVETKKVLPADLVIMGESLGSAVALDLALEKPAAALVLEAPFTSVPDMARTTALFALAPLVRTRYDNLGKVARLERPLLILHGDRDEVVPFRLGQKLFEAAGQPKTFLAVPGAGHNDVYLVGGAAYWRAIADFLSGLPGRRGAA